MDYDEKAAKLKVDPLPLEDFERELLGRMNRGEFDTVVVQPDGSWKSVEFDDLESGFADDGKPG